MTHAEEIVQAIKTLVEQGRRIFSRKEVRDRIGVDHETWMAGYTAIFQGMRVDQPGGAPKISSKFRNAIRRIERGRYSLTEYGVQLITQTTDDLEEMHESTLGLKLRLFKVMAQLRRLYNGWNG